MINVSIPHVRIVQENEPVECCHCGAEMLLVFEFCWLSGNGCFQHDWQHHLRWCATCERKRLCRWWQPQHPKEEWCIYEVN